jgi:hypothetical protein
MSSPVVAWMMRMWRPLISIRMGVRAWVRPMPMWCSRPLWRRVSLPSASMMSRRTRACGSAGGEAAGLAFGSGLVGSGGGAAVQGAVRPAAVVVDNKGVAEGFQLGDRGGLLRLGPEPLLQGLLEPFDFAAGGGVGSAWNVSRSRLDGAARLGSR